MGEIDNLTNLQPYHSSIGRNKPRVDPSFNFPFLILQSLSLLESESVFRRQKYLICNSGLWKAFYTIAFDLKTFSNADKRLCAVRPSANMFPRTNVGKLRGLSITDAQRCMPVSKPWAISRSKNKVRLSSTSSIAFERSSRSNDQRAPRIKQARFENTSGPRFAKRDFRNEFLESRC